eukprot:12902663-Prorocentrum_lima.AAC.1
MKNIRRLSSAPGISRLNHVNVGDAFVAYNAHAEDHRAPLKHDSYHMDYQLMKYPNAFQYE